MKKIIVLLAIISVGFWFWSNKNIKKPVVEETLKETPNSEEIFKYDSETDNDHIIFNIGNLDFEFKRIEDSMETDLVVKKGSETLFSKKYPDSVLSISKILFKDKNIVLVNYYSGGAHCCSLVIPYIVDNEKFIEGEGLDLGNIDIFNGDSFFIQDNKLFTSSVDDRFAYFEMDYADSGSMFFTTYYELMIDPLKFVNRNELFVDSYSKSYSKAQTDSREKVNKENCSKDEIGKYQVFASLVSRYTYGFLSGVDREKLKTELSNDWWCFPEKDLSKTENDIYQALTENNKSDDFVKEILMTGYEKAKEIVN